MILICMSISIRTYLILHTQVTLGYDVPWEKVHRVLILPSKIILMFTRRAILSKSS